MVLPGHFLLMLYDEELSKEWLPKSLIHKADLSTEPVFCKMCRPSVVPVMFPAERV